MAAGLLNCRADSAHQADVIVLDQNPVIQRKRWLLASAHAHRVLLQDSGGPAWFCACPGIPLWSPANSSLRRRAKVAMPLMCWRKFSATRSAASSVRRGAARDRQRRPGAHLGAVLDAGSTRGRGREPGTLSQPPGGRPPRGLFALNVPLALIPSGTVTRVVRSPWPRSSASACSTSARNSSAETPSGFKSSSVVVGLRYPILFQFSLSDFDRSAGLQPGTLRIAHFQLGGAYPLTPHSTLRRLMRSLLPPARFPQPPNCTGHIPAGQSSFD